MAPATAQIELKTLSENVVDSAAGTGPSLGGRILNVRVGRDESGNPSIVYTREGEVRIFWCDDESCSSGTNELILPDDMSGRNIVLSPVVYDSVGGPHFIASVYGLSGGFFTYVQCSNTTCANPTEWDTQPLPPAAPMFWTQNAQAVEETGATRRGRMTRCISTTSWFLLSESCRNYTRLIDFL